MTRARQAINPGTVMTPAGVYSNGLLSNAGPMLSVAGQVGVDPHGAMPLGADAEGQARQAFTNVLAIVEAAGGVATDVVSLMIHVTDIEDMGAVNAARAALFAEPYPASTLVQVAALAHPALRIEVTAIAIIES
jgi:2-iminobutanoate/2-iminopropanoate deaminase